MPIVRALSIDIGWKHLAYAMLEVGSDCRDDQGANDEKDFSIKAWNCESLLASVSASGVAAGDEEINVNSTSLDELIRMTVPSIAKILEFWTKWPGLADDGDNTKPTIAFLEQQPLGMQARNVKSKTLSHVLQGLLISRGIPVVFISPQKKLKYMEQSGNYSDNKKFAVEETLRLLHAIDPNESSNKWLQHFKSFKKKDDLADSLLQGLYASKDHILALIKQEAKEAKKRAQSLKSGGRKRKHDQDVLTDTQTQTEEEPCKGLLNGAAKTKQRRKAIKREKSRKAAEASVALDEVDFNVNVNVSRHVVLVHTDSSEHEP